MRARMIGIAAGLLLTAGIAQAGVIYPLGGGWYAGSDDQGHSFTSYPLGGGWRVTTDGEGGSVTTYPLGGGWIGTSESPAPGARGSFVGLGGDDGDGDD